jgi:hypothetical protein
LIRVHKMASGLGDVRERATGIKPALSAWEARRGVLSDLRISGKSSSALFARDRWYSLMTPVCRGMLHEMEANRSVARCCTEPGRSQLCELRSTRTPDSSVLRSNRLSAIPGCPARRTLRATPRPPSRRHAIRSGITSPRALWRPTKPAQRLRARRLPSACHQLRTTGGFGRPGSPSPRSRLWGNGRRR